MYVYIHILVQIAWLGRQQQLTQPKSKKKTKRSSSEMTNPNHHSKSQKKKKTNNKSSLSLTHTHTLSPYIAMSADSSLTDPCSMNVYVYIYIYAYIMNRVVDNESDVESTENCRACQGAHVAHICSRRKVSSSVSLSLSLASLCLSSHTLSLFLSVYVSDLTSSGCQSQKDVGVTPSTQRREAERK